MFIADMPIGAPKKSTEPVKLSVTTGAPPAKSAGADEPPLMRRVEDEIGLTVLAMVGRQEERTGKRLSVAEYKNAELAAFRGVEASLITYLMSMRRKVKIIREGSKFLAKDIEPKHVGSGRCDDGWEHEWLGLFAGVKDGKLCSFKQCIRCHAKEYV